MNKCKFTIVTVCYNAEECIEDTIQSVLSQTYDDFEYIIKDGLSTDQTMNRVRQLTNDSKHVIIVQGKDTGIYDAMNIAVCQASGEYILFLNAGDVLHDKTVFSKLAEGIDREKADVYYGNIIQIDTVNNVIKQSERVHNQNSIKKIQYSVGRCICHQAMFASRELFGDKQFATNFRVCADREWQLYHLSNKRKFLYLPIVISDVLTDGFSKDHVKELEEETRKCVCQYCKQYLWIYDTIIFLKKNSFIKRLLQRLDSISAVK